MGASFIALVRRHVEPCTALILLQLWLVSKPLSWTVFYRKACMNVSAKPGAERLERESMGEVAVPAERLWGVQTQRSLEFFDISTEKLPPELMAALMLIKRACAAVNLACGLLPSDKARAIKAAADEVLAGQHAGEFPLSVWQTGSGTQTHMNVNEVLPSRDNVIIPPGESATSSFQAKPGQFPGIQQSEQAKRWWPPRKARPREKRWPQKYAGADSSPRTCSSQPGARSGRSARR